MVAKVITDTQRTEYNTTIEVKGKLKYNTPAFTWSFPSTIILNDVMIVDLDHYDSADGATLHFNLYSNGVLIVEDIIPSYAITTSAVTTPVSIMPMPASTKTYIGSKSMKEFLVDTLNSKTTVGTHTALTAVETKKSVLTLQGVIKEKPPASGGGGGTVTTTPSTAEFLVDNSYLAVLFRYI